MLPTSGTQRVRSGIPQPTTKKTANLNINNIGSESQRSVDDNDPPKNSARSVNKVPLSTQHPLAAAMAKKKTPKKPQVSETWADVKMQGQSQKMRGISNSDSLRRKEDIERQLREAEGQLGEMSDLIEQREKMLEENKNEANQKIGELEERLMDQEGILAEHGIDPVTGQKVPLSEEDKKKVQNSKKITKKTVQAMRDRLQDMNRQTETFLADIENTMQYLASLEDASDKAGPFSEETQAMINRMHGDDSALQKVLTENAGPVKTVAAEVGDGDEDEEEDDGRTGQFFITDNAEGGGEVMQDSEGDET